MAVEDLNRHSLEVKRRKKLIIILALVGLPLFGVLFSLSSFQLKFITPQTTEQTVVLVALTLLVSLLFGGLIFVLMRNLIKLFAERRLGIELSYAAGGRKPAAFVYSCAGDVLVFLRPDEPLHRAMVFHSG